MRFSKRVEFVRRLLKAGAKQKLIHALEKLAPLQSSYILRQLSSSERKSFFEFLLGNPFLEKILQSLPDNSLPEVLAPLDSKALVQVLSQSPADWVWSFLQTKTTEEQADLQSQLPKELQEKLSKRGQYPPDSCGEVMSTELIYVKESACVEEAIQILRQADPQLKIFYFYVVDEEGHLLGTVPLRSLIREDGKTAVAKVMAAHAVAVFALEPRQRAAQMVSQHKLLAIPVVDESHHLLGVIRMDDVIDIVQEEATEEMYKIAGLSKNDRIFAPWWKTTQKRLAWMSVNLFTAFLAAWVVGLFEESIHKVVALAIFMPVVAGMGGNGGIQSLTVMTRALALGEIGGREVWRLLSKEVLVGFMVGAITGLATGLIVWSWRANIYLGFVLWLAMIVNMVIAALGGTMIPLLFRKMKSDPALGSGVIVTTFTDVFGFLTFLGLATIFLKYLT